jgi:diguanylate cyclase (GGDEF)-like protein
MNKEDAKRLLATVHDELLRLIEEGPEKVEERALIDFIHDLPHSLVSQGVRASYDLRAPVPGLDEAYREIALHSLDSYVGSNKMFAEISKEHQAAVGSLHETDDLAGQFRQIQSNLSHEVERANAVIEKLTGRIQELESKVSLDPLTKVYNRRAMERYLGQLIRRFHKMQHMPPYLLMIDIDDFKQVNDTYGHIAGDKVLIFLANLLKQTLRESDKIFRYGGEEFIVALNRISDQGVHTVAERIISLMRKNRLKYKEHDFNVTLSVGVTMLRAGDTLETLIDRADRAVYRAKKRGKDQICVE